MGKGESSRWSDSGGRWLKSGVALPQQGQDERTEGGRDRGKQSDKVSPQ